MYDYSVLRCAAGWIIPPCPSAYHLENMEQKRCFSWGTKSCLLCGIFATSKCPRVAHRPNDHLGTGYTCPVIGGLGPAFVSMAACRGGPARVRWAPDYERCPLTCVRARHQTTTVATLSTAQRSPSRQGVSHLRQVETMTRGVAQREANVHPKIHLHPARHAHAAPPCSIASGPCILGDSLWPATAPGALLCACRDRRPEAASSEGTSSEGTSLAGEELGQLAAMVRRLGASTDHSLLKEPSFWPRSSFLGCTARGYIARRGGASAVGGLYPPASTQCHSRHPTPWRRDPREDGGHRGGDHWGPGVLHETVVEAILHDSSSEEP